ncbi:MULTISPECIES: hypothetical protein [unclassified Staphylococcus]|uniref:hypothetical protein n=1 Tax=unclassified Staphylococcus TaxID=91994 RepID=UPI0021CF43C2|nr:MULTISPECIES: hypothetical protein [unclassified Staphylococcus]UXR79009.1 hypothetical protein MUA92_03725 [Staphylococcus sp. IVB6227]UXR83168.1 hypothetical protein MUA51_03695 [Staphylococcus sp. IVB6214]
MNNLLIIKLTGEKPKNKQEIIERASSGWKISPKRLNDVKYVVVLYQQIVIATYQLGKMLTYNKNIAKVTKLDLTETKDLDIVGQGVSYPTSNPATISSLDNLFKNK